MASWLIVVAPIGSNEHNGAPTSAAKGIIASAFFINFNIVSFCRISPFTTLKLGWWQQWLRLACLNIKLSKTVTLWPAARRSGTIVEPKYPEFNAAGSIK